MKYAIVDLLWAKSHGIEILPEMRTSIDQSKVILHEETLVPFEDESFSRIYVSMIIRSSPKTNVSKHITIYKL
jgi:hypothetical protein